MAIGQAQIKDKFGNDVYVGNCKDFFIPAFLGSEAAFLGSHEVTYAEHAANVRGLEVRADDVLVCCYPKTGYHWMEAIMDMLKRKSTTHGTANSTFLDPGTTMAAKLSSPRILMTHFPFRAIPKQAIEKKVKIVFLTRNPKDTAVSFYNHLNNGLGSLGYHGTFESFFDLFMTIGPYYNQMFDYLLEFQEGFTAHPEVPTFTSSYEDMKRDPVGGVKKLNEFLETGCDDAMCAAIAKACDFDALRAEKDATRPAYLKAIFKEGAPTFYRKGAVGDWKNWFTVAQSERFDKEYARRMAGYKTQFTYEL